MGLEDTPKTYGNEKLIPIKNPIKIGQEYVEVNFSKEVNFNKGANFNKGVFFLILNSQQNLWGGVCLIKG